MAKCTPSHPELQAFSPWVDDANRLTPTEIAVEAAYHHLLVSIARPPASPMQAALVAVLALPEYDEGRAL